MNKVLNHERSLYKVRFTSYKIQSTYINPFTSRVGEKNLYYIMQRWQINYFILKHFFSNFSTKCQLEEDLENVKTETSNLNKKLIYQ